MNFKKAEKTNTNQKNKRLKSEYTIKRIKEKYLLLIKEKKWDKITVKEICAEANITRGTFTNILMIFMI